MIKEALDKKYRKTVLNQLCLQYAISFDEILNIAHSIIRPFNVYNYPDFNIFIAFLESTIKCHNSYAVGYC